MKYQNTLTNSINSQHQLNKYPSLNQKMFQNILDLQNHRRPGSPHQLNQIKFNYQKLLSQKKFQSNKKLTPISTKNHFSSTPNSDSQISPFQQLSKQFIDYLDNNKKTQERLNSNSSQAVSTQKFLSQNNTKLLQKIKSHEQKNNKFSRLEFNTKKNNQKSIQLHYKSNTSIKQRDWQKSRQQRSNLYLQKRSIERNNSGKKSQNLLFNILNPSETLKNKFLPQKNDILKKDDNNTKAPNSSQFLRIKQQMKKFQMYKNRTPTTCYDFKQMNKQRQTGNKNPAHSQMEYGKIFDRKLSLVSNCEKIRFLSQFIILKIIGKGKFGEVYLAKHKITCFIFALKKISKKKIIQYKMQNQLIQQIKIQSFCDHPNIVQLYNCFYDLNHIYLVLQYLPQGTLFHKMYQNKKIKQKQISLILKQTTLAIKYLHQHNIAHRDLKPQNLVLSCGIVKLCDFGWAAIVKGGGRKTYCGTFQYVAPQILQRKQYGVEIDLWCLGVLAYQLLTKKVPFQHAQRKISINKITNVDNQTLQFPEQVSKEGIDFVKCLLKKNPEQRLKPYKLLQHQFFRNHLC